jgi:hypothetical protein
MQVVEGIYLPSSDVHFAEQIRNGPLVEGKGTYQLTKLRAALEVSPHGATKAEIAFLGRKRRVELNAMTSRQLIDFVEGKLDEHGVKKLVPDEAILIEHARRLIEQQLAAAEVEKLKPKLSQAAARVPLPADLRQKIEQRLAAERRLSWDMASAEVLGRRPLITRPIR